MHYEAAPRYAQTTPQQRTDSATGYTASHRQIPIPSLALLLSQFFRPSIHHCTLVAMLRIRPSGGMALQQRAGACLSPMTSSLRVPKLSPRHPRSRRAVRCMASFLPDDLEDILQVGTVVASSLAILGTAALAYRSPRRPPPSPADDDSGQFGVMTVVSCIPLFNWTVSQARQGAGGAARETCCAASDPALSQHAGCRNPLDAPCALRG